MSLKKKLKKVGKAAAVAGAAYLATRALSGAGTGVNIDKGRGSALSQRYRKPYKDSIMSGGKGVQKGKIGIMDKIKNTTSDVIKKTGAAVEKIKKEKLNLGPGPNATSKMGGTLAGDYGDAFSDAFGNPQGAKAGKMMYAKNGTYVKAKCKLGRNKKTLIT